MARYLGTGRYLAIQSGIVVIWILLNLAAVSLRWDPYPFILLNLVFSTQAAYAAPLILLAQNRQADRDRVEIERDRDTNARQLAESEFLAREIAALRISIERKADREDLIDAMHEIRQALGRRMAGEPVEFGRTRWTERRSGRGRRDEVRRARDGRSRRRTPS